jgi:hypothetical protein
VPFDVFVLPMLPPIGRGGQLDKKSPLKALGGLFDAIQFDERGETQPAA